MVDYLNNQGVKDIKYLIATHSHADHLGGLDSVVKNFNIENVLYRMVQQKQRVIGTL